MGYGTVLPHPCGSCTPPLRIDKIAQRYSESMHSVDKGYVGTERQKVFKAAGGKKFV